MLVYTYYSSHISNLKYITRTQLYMALNVALSIVHGCLPIGITCWKKHWIDNRLTNQATLHNQHQHDYEYGWGELAKPDCLHNVGLPLIHIHDSGWWFYSAAWLASVCSRLTASFSTASIRSVWKLMCTILNDIIIEAVRLMNLNFY